MDDPRTKQGNESYPAPGGVGNEGASSSQGSSAVSPGGNPSPAPVAPAQGGVREVPGPVPAPVSHPVSAPVPEHPETGSPTKEEPAGSSNTTVPQQVPKPKEPQ